MRPADGNPLGLHLHSPQRQPQLAKRRGQVSVDDDLVEQVAVLALHRLGRPQHLLKVLVLRGARERGRRRQELRAVRSREVDT